MKRLSLLTVVALLGLCHSACISFITWTPVCSGIEYEGDSSVKIDDVEILVGNFGSMGGSLFPEFTLWIKNRGDSLIVFDASACRINIDGIIVSPDKSPQIRIHQIEPYYHLDIKYKFLNNLNIALKNSSKKIDWREGPETITLQLAPIKIGEQIHSIPIMTFKHPFAK